MKKILLNFWLLFFPLVLMAQQAKKVLIIGIDGCRPDAIEVANTPHLDGLIANGIFSPDALNDDITISGPGWSAILCGVWSPKHLVVDNNFTADDYETYPTFFKRAKQYDSAFKTVSICHWSPINDEIIKDQADFTLNVSSDVEVASQASSYLAINDPDLMFLHFDEADGAGHGFGFSPNVPEYVSVIEHIDSLVGSVMGAIENRSTFNEEDWLILLTTDHGGLGASHGGDSIEEQQVFVIASGGNVVPQRIVKDSTVTSIEINNCLGDSIELHFDGMNDRVEIPDSPTLNFGANQDFTIECRVRTTQSADVAIVGNKDWNSGLNKGFVFSFKFPSGPEWKVNIGDGENRADLNSGGEIADNAWHTLSVTFDRDGFMKMYQDGSFLDSTDISFIGDIYDEEGLVIGTDINADFDYKGAVSEVRVWNGVLEESSILDWHCKSLDNMHPNYSELVAYWKLNEGVGNSVVDNSINNSDPGLVVGADWRQPDSLVTSFDFSNTPRSTDIFPTVLTHLCIPIEQGWGLDGASLIPSCEVSSTMDVKSSLNVDVYPNPGVNEVILELAASGDLDRLSAAIYNASGVRLMEVPVSSKQTKINVSFLSEGVYVLKVMADHRVLKSEKLLIK